MIWFFKDAYKTLLNLVQQELENTRTKKQKELPTDNDKNDIENNDLAYKELYELTQRKFLKRISANI